MAVVQLDMNEYRSMERRQESADKKIRSLIEEVKEKEDGYLNDLDNLRQKKAVLVIEKDDEGNIFSVENIDNVKKEVEEHYKQGLFNDELTRLANKQFSAHIEENDRLKETVKQLNAEISRIKHRSFIERIFNIYK